eukprot:344064-Rhodomonas_salina.1
MQRWRHHSNGRSESAIGTISARARAMLAQMNVPKKFWPQAVLYATELDNSCTPYKTGSDMTAYEAMHGRKPDNSKI